MAPLRDLIMAALSEGHRRSAHPADRRAQGQEATRIALAIQAEFILLPRNDPAQPAQVAGVLLPAKS